MKKLILLTTILLSMQLAYSQTLKRTYYDWKKTSVDEEYFVNSKGEKNGTYKKYSENGIVELTGTLKNGYWNGLVTTYSTSTGRQSLASKETYVNGEKEGPAVYYNRLNYPMKQGSYKDDKEDGPWIIIQLFKDSYDYTEEEKKGCSFVKHNAVFNDGEEVYEGKIIWTFYPSGKIAMVQNFLNGKQVGEELQYWPNGQMSYKHMEHVSTDTWDREGKLLLHEDIAAAELKANEENAAEQKRNRERMEQEAKNKAEELAVDKANCRSGDSAVLVNNYELAVLYYKRIRRVNELSDGQFIHDMLQYSSDINEANESAINSGPSYGIEKYQRILISCECSSKFINLISEKINELKEIPLLREAAAEKFNDYYKALVEKKNTIFIDVNNLPITKEKYLHGEYLYKKSKLVMDSYMATLNSSKNIDSLRVTSLTIKNACDKMIQISTGDTKEIDKQLKKVEDVEEIKRILGI